MASTTGYTLIPLPQRIERWKGQTHLGPESAHDQLAPPGLTDGCEELLVLPCVDGGPVDRRMAVEQLCQRRDR
jgi:hypothetical protein